MAANSVEAHATPTPAQAAHKSPNYILIFVWLIVITAAEIGVGYIPHEIIPVVIAYPVLLIMAVAKVVLVALYYMHLRYDNKWFLVHMLSALPLSVLFILAVVLGFLRK